MTLHAQKLATSPLEPSSIVGGREPATSPAREPTLHLGMPDQPIFQSIGHERPLRDHLARSRSDPANPLVEHRVVRTSQKQFGRRGFGSEQRIQVAVEEPFRSGTFQLSGFHQGHPQGAGLLDDMQARGELFQFHEIGTRGDRPLRAQDRDGSFGHPRFRDTRNGARRQAGQDLGGGTDHSENGTIGSVDRQMLLLDGPQRPSAGGVAGEDDQGAALIEHPLDRFEGEAMDHLQTPGTIRRPGGIRQVQVVVVGKLPEEGGKDGESSETGVEYANHKFNVGPETNSYDLFVNIPGLLLSLVLTQTHSDTIRCGLSNLDDAQRTAFAAGLLQSGKAVDPTNSLQLLTEHFVLWYRLGNDSDALPASLSTIPPGDSVPELVRLLSGDFEHAWKQAVDTMGVLPPLPAPSGFVIGGATPPGKYPVEICRPGKARGASSNESYFGLANNLPGDPERSGILVSSQILSANVDFPMDRGGNFRLSYSVLDAWIAALRATSVHEFQHAYQFRYEQNLNHFLFEASAVAMEDRLLPDVTDNIFYFQNLFGYPASTETTRGLMVTTQGMAYRHGLYVIGLLSDHGDGIIPALWEDRKARRQEDAEGKTILATMRSILEREGSSWSRSLERYGLRILFTGKRMDWSRMWAEEPGFPTWRHADLAPTLRMVRSLSDSQWVDLPVSGGQLAFATDTSIAGDVVLDWHAEEGGLLVRLDSTSKGIVVNRYPAGSHRIRAADRRKSLWILTFDGTSPRALNPDRSLNSTVHLRLYSSPPLSITASGRSFRQRFPQGSVLTGVARSNDTTLPTLVEGHHPPLDADGDLLVGSGVLFTLADAERALSLTGSVLALPGKAGAHAFRRTSVGWSPVSGRISGDSLLLDLGTLDLSQPLTLIVSATAAPPARLGLVFPNPSLGGAPITFEVLGEVDGARLTILAADGSLVRTWSSASLHSKLQWNLRNQEGERVRPGVYTWIYANRSSSKRGRLLIGQ